jgi:hypothetical protein
MQAAKPTGSDYFQRHRLLTRLKALRMLQTRDACPPLTAISSGTLGWGFRIIILNVIQLRSSSITKKKSDEGWSG